MAEDDDRDIDGTEYGEFVRFLEKAAFPFQKGTRWRISAYVPVRGMHETYTERLRSSLIALISIFLRPMENEAE